MRREAGPGGLCVVNDCAAADAGSGGLLESFLRAGVLQLSDVHVALRLGRIGGESDALVLLAAALSVRAPRVGHVSVDLAGVRDVVYADSEETGTLDGLSWPDPPGWLARVAASPLVAMEGCSDQRPLRLEAGALYLDRYWRDELVVAKELVDRAGAELPQPGEKEAGDPATVARGRADGDQLKAAAAVSAKALAVVAGGPGTGKTTSVALAVALLHIRAAASAARPPLVALAAPTGRAAARLESAVRAESAKLVIPPVVREAMIRLEATTLHRLLGSRLGGAGFRHGRSDRLPHDLVVVDEASMVSLALMARLLEACRPDARLALVGDPGQLVSVEAGAVLADIVGPALRRERLPGLGPCTPISSSIVVLGTNHRFGGALAALAEAVRFGDADSAVKMLRSGDRAIEWFDGDPDAYPLEDKAGPWAASVVEAARAGQTERALALLASNRVLCGRRRGSSGAERFNRRIETWLRAVLPYVPAGSSGGGWYPGRPVLVTANDHSLKLYNGDTGVAVTRMSDAAGSICVGFDHGGDIRLVSAARLEAVETAFAMTIHKSQGSEFDEVTLVLPEPGSPLLTRELLYTALTRSRGRVVLVGLEEAVRAALQRPMLRASGLTRRLWGAGSAAEVHESEQARTSRGPSLA